MPDASGFALLLGPADGTHLAIGSAALEAFAVMGTGREDVGVGIAAQRAEVVVRAGDGDAFLKRVLPTEGLRVEFDLGLAWSQRGGVVIAGGLSTAVTLPIHLGLGPFEIDSVHLALDADVTGRTLGATAALTLKMEIVLEGGRRAHRHHGRAVLPPVERWRPRPPAARAEVQGARRCRHDDQGRPGHGWRLPLHR